MSVTILPERCPQNHPCPSVQACPAGALSQTGHRAPEVNAEKCTGCAVCVRYCPMGVFKPAVK